MNTLAWQITALLVAVLTADLVLLRARAKVRAVCRATPIHT